MHEIRDGWAGQMSIPRELHVKDGKIFSELVKDENESRKDFFEKIIEVTSVLGGDMNELI